MRFLESLRERKTAVRQGPNEGTNLMDNRGTHSLDRAASKRSQTGVLGISSKGVGNGHRSKGRNQRLGITG